MTSTERAPAEGTPAPGDAPASGGPAAGKAVLVTGGASGIGAAAARRFAEAGAAAVVVADRDGPGAEAVAAAIKAAGGRAWAEAVDVTDEAAVAAVVDAAAAECGGLDAAFNCAGVTDQMSSFHQLDLDAWDRMIAVNLTGVFLCMKHELRHMAEAGAGAVVNASSGAGLVAAPGLPHYTAAKHGVIGLTKAAASEYARRGVRVNAVLPGATDTPMIRGFIGGDEKIAAMIASTNVGGRLLDPREVADAVVWLASDAARLVNGQSLIVDGGSLIR